jgi:O-6-methylguanine DNA methyltransferase
MPAIPAHPALAELGSSPAAERAAVGSRLVAIAGLGTVRIHASADGLRALDLIAPPDAGVGQDRPASGTVESDQAQPDALPHPPAPPALAAAIRAHLDQAVRDLEAFAAGAARPRRTGTPAPAAWFAGRLDPQCLAHCSGFTERVLLALQTVPGGALTTYAELAARCGNPRATRAVGSALGRNPLPIFIPCHRVLASAGLGGFTPGLSWKRHLLRLEGHSSLIQAGLRAGTPPEPEAAPPSGRRFQPDRDGSRDRGATPGRFRPGQGAVSGAWPPPFAARAAVASRPDAGDVRQEAASGPDASPSRQRPRPRVRPQ